MEVIKLIAIITPILITVATVYLRLFVKNEINELLKVISENYVSNKVFDVEKARLQDKFELMEPKSAHR